MSKEILAGRNTVSKKVPEIDSLYVYQTRHRVKLTHRQQPGVGYPYTNKKALMRAGEDEIHVYHRTATIRGIPQGLAMITKDHRYREVQRFFNEQIVAISEDDKLFEKFSHAKVSPAELGLYYIY